MPQTISAFTNREGEFQLGVVHVSTVRYPRNALPSTVIAL